MLTNMIDEYIAIEKFVKNPADIVKSIKHSTDVRVTIIKDDGQVLYESDREIKGMENHLSRPEVQQALSEGTGILVKLGLFAINQGEGEGWGLFTNL